MLFVLIPAFTANNNIQGSSLLHLACDRGHVHAVSSLLSAGADVNQQDAEFTTPLHNGNHKH